ncbi:MAG: hypothetical protein WBL74_13675 [Novosphingobium sp.]|uniref:hypothetical protein n=1 Tax=Novosphingobium sp. TaxID=1874826 RepID=UPI003C7B052C
MGKQKLRYDELIVVRGRLAAAVEALKFQQKHQGTTSRAKINLAMQHLKQAIEDIDGVMLDMHN